MTDVKTARDVLIDHMDAEFCGTLDMSNAVDTAIAALTAAGYQITPVRADDGVRVHRAPDFDTLKGLQFYAVDSDRQWFYVNHANTWQACPPLSDAGDAADGVASAGRDADARDADAFNLAVVALQAIEDGEGHADVIARQTLEMIDALAPAAGEVRS